MPGYLPSLPDLKNMVGDAASNIAGELAKLGRPMFAPGLIGRTDGLPVDRTLKDLRTRFEKQIADGDTEQARQTHALASRLASVSDLTEDLYDRFAANPASIANWFPAVEQAVTESGSDLRLPATSIVRLPIELAQYLRVEYTQTNQVSRESFDELVFDALALERGRTYFLKTGTFSSKFEFANARCAEPEEAGQYFQVINNAAMSLGAGDTVDLCAREYIEPVDGTPTIYHGMPLRTELRAFIDLGAPFAGAESIAQALGFEQGPPVREPQLLGITPYWHSSVMTRALALAESEPGMDHIRGDYQTYVAAHHDLNPWPAADHRQREQDRPVLLRGLPTHATGEIDLQPDHVVLRRGRMSVPRFALTRGQGERAMSAAWPETDPAFPSALPGATIVWADLIRGSSAPRPDWLLGASIVAERNCGGQDWILVVRCRNWKQRDRIDRAAAALGITDSVAAVLTDEKGR